MQTAPRTQTALRLLIVEDSEDDAALLLLLLQNAGYEIVSERTDSAEAWHKLSISLETSLFRTTRCRTSPGSRR
jgi:CheY-like chemotaxis protein